MTQQRISALENLLQRERAKSEQYRTEVLRLTAELKETTSTVVTKPVIEVREKIVEVEVKVVDEQKVNEQATTIKTLQTQLEQLNAKNDELSASEQLSAQQAVQLTEELNTLQAQAELAVQQDSIDYDTIIEAKNVEISTLEQKTLDHVPFDYYTEVTDGLRKQLDDANLEIQRLEIELHATPVELEA